MDFVIVTYAPDIKLLRHCIASYDLYYRDKHRLFIFAAQADKQLLQEISIPGNATLLFREDFPEVLGLPDVSQAAYLKLISYQVVTTEYFCIIDSDFLFIAPTSEEDFFRDGKPLWFYRAPLESEPPLRSKEAAESFIGEKMDYIFMDQPQYVFKRSIAAHLAATHSLLNKRHEFVIYGWFAHKYHVGEYNFIRTDQEDTGSIVGLVNQIPPDYLHLDAGCNYEQFKSYKLVAFWSYWELADQKMIEFFEESQTHHFGQVIRKADRNPLMCLVDLDDVTKAYFHYFEGIFLDGWVKDVVKFTIRPPDDWRSFVIEFMIPKNPHDPKWELAGDILTGNSVTKDSFSLAPGPGFLPIQIPLLPNLQAIKMELYFGPGFKYPSIPDNREFRARLITIRNGSDTGKDELLRSSTQEESPHVEDESA